MSLIQTVILGLIQGLTEFLPVSSSGHVLLACEILGVESSLAFELVLHLATLLAVVIFYRKTLINCVKKPFCKLNLHIVAASAVTAVIAVILKKSVEKFFHSAEILPAFFILTAILLVVGSFFGRGNKPLTLTRALIIGAAQGIAVIPGLSRSGTTISAALILGVEKQQATEFSFLLSIPVILGSAVIELILNPIENVAILPLIAAFAVAFVSGYLALMLVTRLMKKASLDVFSLYLIALSTVTLIFM